MNQELQAVTVDGGTMFVPTEGEGDFDELVRRDVQGLELSDDEYALLEGDLDQWRASLLVMLQNVDREFTRRKTLPMRKYEVAALNQDMMQQKHAVLERMREVNVMIKERNADNSPGQNDTLAKLLEEVKAIRALMEARQ